MTDASLEGRVAVVTGGLGDIGRAVTAKLVSLGAVVAVCDLVAPAAEPLVAARYDAVDVRDNDAVDAWLNRVASTLGTPTIVVANAAVATARTLREITSVDWERDIAVNLHGAFHVCVGAARRMAAQSMPGRIVLVGSWAAHVPHAHVPSYSVSKAGLRMLTRLLALEFADEGILVNEVAPGFVDAGLSGRAFAADSSLRSLACATVPTGVLIEPGDVAREVARLCEPETTHLTGSTVVMDGGLSLLGAPRVDRHG